MNDYDIEMNRAELECQGTEKSSTTLDVNTLTVIAVEELDAIVSKVTRRGALSISPKFYDWANDTLTKKVEINLIAAINSGRFEATLQLGSTRDVVSVWVKQWVCAEIKQEFKQYVEFCPCSNAPMLVRVGAKKIPVPKY